MTSDDDSIGTMLNAAPVCGSVWTREGRSVDCNDAALHFFGLGSKQTYLDRYAELSPERQPDGEASGPLMLAHLRKAFADGRAGFPWQHRRLDGRIIPAQITLTRVRHASSELVVAYAVDQPGPLPSDATAHDGDARARLMLDHAPLACTFWNARGEIVDCNLESLRMFGLDSKEEYVARIAELWPEYQPDGGRSADLVKQYVNQAVLTGRVALPIPWMRQTVAGEPIPCEASMVRVMKDGEPLVAGFLRDLREEWKLQAEKRAADERTRLMLDNAPLACTFWNARLELVDCNLQALNLFGVSSKQEFIERYGEFLPESQPDGGRSDERVSQYIFQAMQTGRLTAPLMRRTLAGEQMPCEVTVVRVMQDGEPMMASFNRDLREEWRLQAEKREADERTQIMLDATPMVCTFWNEEPRPIDCNQEAVNLFELEDKQAYLDRFFELSPEYQPGGRRSRELAQERVGTALREGSTRFEWMHQKLNGEPVPAEIILRRVPRDDGYVVASYMRDLRELKETVAGLKRLEKLAYTDRLTGVANRSYFLEHATAELGRLSPGGSASLLIFDIDHFKKVNDTYGHSGGDLILRGVADRVQKSLRPYDLFARYGGEEFVILLVRAGLDAALTMADRVREAIARAPFEYEGRLIDVTISIGVVCCSYPAPPLQDLIDQADTALYQAKNRGRNRVEHIQPAE